MRRVALAVIVLSSLAITAAYASAFLGGPPPRWATWAFALAIPLLMTAIMVLGAARADRRLGRLALPFAFTCMVLTGGFAVVLLLPGDPEALWLGLPRRAAIILYGIGLLPVLVLPLTYAWTFDSLTLNQADLDRIRAARTEASRE